MSDALPIVLDALSQEVEAVARFDEARDVCCDLIEVGADDDAVHEALGHVYRHLGVVRARYFRLEALMISAGWSMERPDELPAALRTAIEAEVVPHERHLADTALAERTIGAWLDQRGLEADWRRYRRTEMAHSARRGKRRHGP
jgi:hypothetical protein